MGSLDELVDRIRAALEDRSLSKVSRLCGVHENTIRAIRDGKNKNPKMSTVQALSKYLFGKS